MIQMHKIITGAVDVDKNLFVNAQKSVSRAHNLKLRKMKVTILPRIRAFSNRVIGKLPPKVVNASTPRNSTKRATPIVRKFFFRTIVQSVEYSPRQGCINRFGN